MDIEKMFRENKRKFCEITTKASFGLLFWIGLMIPFYSGSAMGITVRVSMFLMDIWYVYFFGILALTIVYAVFAFQLKEEKAQKVFKISTIVYIVMYARFLLSYILDSSDSIVTTSMGFGFILSTLVLAVLILLTWKEALIMNFIYKTFKVPEAKVVEPVEEAPQPEPVPEPEVVAEPAPAPEPAPVPEPEPAPEPKDVEEVEEELEELVEEETKIEDAEQAVESLKEKE